MGLRRLRRLCCLPVGAVTFACATLSAASVAAQGLTLPTIVQPQPFGTAKELPSRSDMSPGSVAVFDYEHTFAATEAEGGPMWWRKAGDNTSHGGWQLSLGGVTETRIGRAYLAGIIRAQFRYFDSKSFAFSPMQNMALVGIRIGPFEPESRVGFSLFTFDVFHGAYSFEMVQPRVEGGFGLRFGMLRFSAHVFSEYLWRWWGDSYFDKGIAFEIRLEAKKKKSPLIIE
jgi:hypothetical protein